MNENGPEPASGHHEVAALSALSEELLGQARQATAGRAARTIAADASLRATLIALVAAAELAEHDAPPSATLQVLAGRVRLRTLDREWLLQSGDLVPIPPERHGLIAETDAAVLLTVALH